MSTGTANTKSTFATGVVLPPETANDLATLLARADDEVLFDLYDIDPPAAASATVVNVGVIPLRPGPLVLGSASAREVTVQPLRVCRSSTSNADPRRMLSGVVTAPTVVALPTAPPAGKWGLELLYAALKYVDASDPAKGTEVTFHWASQLTYVNLGTAATPATIPSHISTMWMIPIAHVKNVNGKTTVDARDILSPTPSATSLLDGKLRRRVGAGSIDARRGYASTTQSIATLAAANAITNAVTPAKVHKGDDETVIRSFSLPASMTGDSGGADVYTDLDDTRDWRNGTFLSFWNVATKVTGTVTPAYLGEEDTGTGASGTRQAPQSINAAAAATVPAQYQQFGQSFEPYLGAGSYAVVGTAQDVGAYGSAPLIGIPYFTGGAGATLQLVVDMSTGVLKLKRNMPGGVAGGPVVIFLIAAFPNCSR